MPRSSVPSRPPDPSYSSTCRRTHSAVLGSYSPSSGTAPANTAVALVASQPAGCRRQPALAGGRRTAAYGGGAGERIRTSIPEGTGT